MAVQATDDNRAHVLCMLDSKHTLVLCILIAFPLQQWLHERTSMYIAGFVNSGLECVVWIFSEHTTFFTT
jgi:hypothetical protein